MGDDLPHDVDGITKKGFTMDVHERLKSPTGLSPEEERRLALEYLREISRALSGIWWGVSGIECVLLAAVIHWWTR